MSDFTNDLLFGKALDGLLDRVYIKDEKRRFIYVNEAMRKACPELTTELIGKRDEDIFNDGHLNKARADDEHIIESRSSIVNKFEVETWKNGSLTSVRTTKQPIELDPSGKLGIFGISREVRVGDPAHLLEQLSAGQEYPVAGEYGVYYENLITKKVWFDERFRQNFPGISSWARFRKIHKRDREAVYQFLRRALHAEPGFNDTVEFRSGSGNGQKVKWIRGHAIVFQSGNEPCLVVAHQEINPLQISELLSRKFLNLFPGFIFVKNRYRRFKFANDVLLKSLGLQLTDVLDKTDEEMGFPPEQVAAFTKGDELALRDEGSKAHFFTDERITFPNGELKSLVTIKISIPYGITNDRSEANQRHLIGISIDTTDWWRKLHEAQEIWHALFKHSADAIYSKDSSGSYLTANESFCRIVGKTLEEIVGAKAADLFIHDSELIKEIDLEDQSVLSAGQMISNIKRTMQLPDGSTQTALTTKIPVKNEKGEIQRILGISRDVTSIERLTLLELFVDPKMIRCSGKLPEPGVKMVAVLFCDIRGFSELADKLQAKPKVLHNLLQRYTELIVGLSEKHKCLLDKFMGDGAMILCGALEDNGRDFGRQFGLQAVGFARELCHEFPLMVENWRKANEGELIRYHTLKIGVGIHVGEAIVGFMQAKKRGQFSAFGDTVNVAQRLESIASKNSVGEIAVSATTAALLCGEYETISHGAVLPEKEKQPLVVFSVGQKK